MCMDPLYHDQDPIKSILGVSSSGINLKEFDLEFVFVTVYTIVDDLYPFGEPFIS